MLIVDKRGVMYLEPMDVFMVINVALLTILTIGVMLFKTYSAYIVHKAPMDLFIIMATLAELLLGVYSTYIAHQTYHLAINKKKWFT